MPREGGFKINQRKMFNRVIMQEPTFSHRILCQQRSHLVCVILQLICHREDFCILTQLSMFDMKPCVVRIHGIRTACIAKYLDVHIMQLVGSEDHALLRTNELKRLKT